MRHTGGMGIQFSATALTRGRGATRCAALLLAALGGGCIYVPQTTEFYDADCQITVRHMELQVEEVGGFGRCRNEGCVALLAAMGAVSATTAVISGSIVVSGNIVYWFEKRGQCIARPGGAR